MREMDTGLHYPIKLDELPPNWVAAFVGDFCDSVQSGFACGKHSDSDIGVPHLRPMNISRNGELDFEIVKYVPSDFDERRLSEDDVLFNNTNSPELIGKTAYVTHKGHGLAFSNHMTRLRFHRSISSQFGAYQLHYLWMARYFLHGCVKHVNQASVSASELAKSVPFVVPPTNEQHRIVAKIEELFSELDQGIAALKTAREQLKVYRQALLKHAFEGKLTAQWRAANPDKLKPAAALLARIQSEREQRYQQQLRQWQAHGGSKPKAPKALPPLTAEELAELPELPDGWSWMKYGDLCSIVRNGISAKPEGESGTPIFRISAVRPLFFDMQDIRYIDNSNGEYDSYCLERGDLVFTRYNGSRHYVGVCAEYRSDEKRLFPDKLVQTRIFSKHISTSYLEKALNSGASRRFVESKIRTTAGQSGVSGDDIKNIPVPFCAYDEQIQIVAELESKLSEADQLELTLATSLQQAEALRQSILKRAFSGRLVPQDPGDEPAAALLERIRAGKYAQSAVPRKKGKGKA